MTRITKKQAKKLYDAGEITTFCPSKCSPQSMMSCMVGNADGETFENKVNHFHYYQCSKATGLTVHFYKNI